MIFLQRRTYFLLYISMELIFLIDSYKIYSFLLLSIPCKLEFGHNVLLYRSFMYCVFVNVPPDLFRLVHLLKMYTENHYISKSSDF